MDRICKEPGGARVVQSRGMCNTHYKNWWRKAEVKPSKPNTRQLILDSMPGTYYQIAAASGFCYATVLIEVKKLREENLAHVGDIEPPQRGASGAKFMRIFYAGPGDDAKVTHYMRVAHRRKTSRESHHIRKAVRLGDPLVAMLCRPQSHNGGA